MEEGAFASVVGEGGVVAEVAEAEFADVDHVGVGKFGWVRAEVPGLELVTAHLDAREVADAGDFGLVLGHAASGAEFLDFFLAAVGFVRSRGFGGDGGFLHIDQIKGGVILGLRGGAYVFCGDCHVGWVAILFAALLQRATGQLIGEVRSCLGGLACCC